MFVGALIASPTVLGSDEYWQFVWIVPVLPTVLYFRVALVKDFLQF